MTSDLYRAIWKTVAEVPKGRVATYGQIARLSGFPRHSRFVSKAMVAAPDELALPWYRIINGQGKSSLKGEWLDKQWDLLAGEGVESVCGKIDLTLYQWDPVFDGMMQEWTGEDRAEQDDSTRSR